MTWSGGRRSRGILWRPPLMLAALWLLRLLPALLFAALASRLATCPLIASADDAHPLPLTVLIIVIIVEVRRGALVERVVVEVRRAVEQIVIHNPRLAGGTATPRRLSKGFPAWLVSTNSFCTRLSGGAAAVCTTARTAATASKRRSGWLLEGGRQGGDDPGPLEHDLVTLGGGLARVASCAREEVGVATKPPLRRA